MNAFLKSPKVLITAGMLLSFAAGAVFQGYTKLGTTNASPDTAVTSAAPAPAVNSLQPRAAAPARVASSAPATARPVQRKRSLAKEALIVGGSAGAGAAIGGVAGGGKGAAIGAVSGGVAGLVYDLATRDKQ